MTFGTAPKSQKMLCPAVVELLGVMHYGSKSMCSAWHGRHLAEGNMTKGCIKV